MKICFLSAMHPPFDIRVFDKEALSLVESGFEVAHLAPMEKGQVGTETRSGVRVVGYPKTRGLLGRVLQLFKLYGLARRIDADVYHCNEVDSWVLGVIIKLLHGKKVVFDIHEHYPSTFSESRFPRALRPLVAGFVRLVFRCLTPFTDRFVLAKKSVAQDFQSARSRLVYAENYARLKLMAGISPGPGETPRGEWITAIHLGVIGKGRGWPQLLEAMSLMRYQKFRVKIIGRFNDGSYPEFEREARRRGLLDRFDIQEWMPFDDAFVQIRASDIGLVLFQPGRMNHVYALPHKMFDCMIAGLPVIAPAFAVEVAPIIEGYRCGTLVDTADPSQIAAALDRLCDDPALRKRQGEAGHRAVVERYNWEQEAERLVAMYKGMEEELHSVAVRRRHAPN